MKNNSDKETKNDKPESNNEKKLDLTINTTYPKASSTKKSPFLFNIYKKGKRLSRQLDTLKNGFSEFIYQLSCDSNNENKKRESIFNSGENGKKGNLQIKINNPNSLSISMKEGNKDKMINRASLTVPKIKIEKENQTKENIKPKKQKYIFKSEEFRKTNLNRLYGYNKKFFKFKNSLKKSKDSELEKYQDDILRLSSINLSRDNLLKLYSDLKNIRINSEGVKPLPPINFRSLITHSLTKKKKVKKGGYLPKSKKFKDMDDYEKEMYKIKVNNKHEQFFSNNKFIYKMYEILPEHIVEKIYVKKKKF